MIMAKKITSIEEFENILAGEKPVLVDFFATWCGPCKMFAPVLDEFAEEHDGVEAVKVDVDELSELARRYGIMSIPTVILFKNGEPVKKNVGFLDAEDLEEFVD